MYDPEEIEILEHLEAHPGGLWEDFPIPEHLMPWWDGVKRAGLVWLGTHHTLPRLSGDGQKALIKHRREPEADGDPPPPTPIWSEAKTPAEWRKILDKSATTLRRHIEARSLIVEKITTKLWRIRLDSLERYQGDK